MALLDRQLMRRRLPTTRHRRQRLYPPLEESLLAVHGGIFDFPQCLNSFFVVLMYDLQHSDGVIMVLNGSNKDS